MSNWNALRFGISLAAMLSMFMIMPRSLAEDMEPVKIELPKPKFDGTPRDIVSSHLRPTDGKSRPPFMAPKGVTNVARGKSVTASDNPPVIGDLEIITDGDQEADEGCYVEFGPKVQWVQVDLGAPHEVFAIVFWHYHSSARVYRDVVVQISGDPDFVKDVNTVFNNDHDNSAKLGVGSDWEYIETREGYLVDCKGAKARYVRLYSNGNTTNDANHMIEVEVYGRPPK